MFEAFRINKTKPKIITYPVVSHPDRFLPFQYSRSTKNEPIHCIKIFNQDDVFVSVIDPVKLNYKLFTNVETATDYILYFGTPVEGLNLSCGAYYLQIDDLYTDLFTVADTSKLIKIEWSNKTDLNDLLYSKGWSQKIYTDEILSEPEYEIERAVNEDALGNQVIVSGRIDKRYKLVLPLVTENVVDAINTLNLMDNVTIAGKKATDIKVNTTWASGADLAVLEVIFTAEKGLVTKCNPAALAEKPALTWLKREYICNPDSTTPYWEDTGNIRCKYVVPRATTETEKEQVDVSPKSPTYTTVRWVPAGNDAVMCPLPPSFSVQFYVTTDRAENTRFDLAVNGVYMATTQTANNAMWYEMYVNNVPYDENGYIRFEFIEGQLPKQVTFNINNIASTVLVDAAGRSTLNRSITGAITVYLTLNMSIN